MVSARKRRVVVMLCVNIRRVAVDQCVWPVIGTDQWCKVPMLDFDLAQALLHLREVVDTAIKHDLAGLIRLLIASIALSDNIIIPRGPLDVRKPPQPQADAGCRRNTRGHRAGRRARVATPRSDT